MKITYLPTDSNNKDFQNLVAQLDAYLAAINGDKNDFYKAFNKIDLLQHVIVCSVDGVAIGCGAFKPLHIKTVEIKRMYLLEAYRGQKYASQILNHLETWAADFGFKIAVLETGIFMPDAIAFYQKNGYQKIDNYGQYKNIETSICFQKLLS